MIKLNVKNIGLVLSAMVAAVGLYTGASAVGMRWTWLFEHQGLEVIVQSLQLDRLEGRYYHLQNIKRNFEKNGNRAPERIVLELKSLRRRIRRIERKQGKRKFN